MIHQFIFASPKPGMTETEFQRYWLEVHAINYASKIKQIRKYMIDTRIDYFGDAGQEPMFGGIAEIWIENEQAQLESLQSPEFLEGARLDEPRWAAFWKTLVLDTDAHDLGDAGTRTATGVKLVTLYRRKEGVDVEAFRRHALGAYADHTLAIPGLRGARFCTTRDSWYGFGEPRFDMVGLCWFDSAEAMAEAAKTPAWQACTADQTNFVAAKHLFSMAVAEHWIIGPEVRS